jgi:hypothetical protein
MTQRLRVFSFTKVGSLLQRAMKSSDIRLAAIEYGGKLSEEEKEKMLKKGWDTNAITPGMSSSFLSVLCTSISLIGHGLHLPD